MKNKNPLDCAVGRQLCRAPFAGAALLLLALADCGYKGTLPLAITPAMTSVAAGTTISFQASSEALLSSGGVFTWTVQPSSCGSIDQQGNFTAGSTAENCEVGAAWNPTNGGPSYRGATTFKVLATPQAEATASSNLLQASGTAQRSGQVQNSPIVGDAVIGASSDSTGRTLIRHGFKPPLPCSNSAFTNQSACDPDLY
jgi:predicted small lipoprotein YifL